MDHFRIEGPAAISFSGGRTSAYMLRRILDAHGGQLPANVVPVFANTGKEREETLRFVHECATRWNVDVHWVEWRDGKPGFENVGYNSASRLGEPFAALIKKKSIPPNWQMRYCTQFLKVHAMMDFLTSTGFQRPYQEVIGLRHDEGMRVLKMLERNDRDGRHCVAPLATAKVTRRDVMAFWRAQPFDLGLDPGEGNCDLCFLKGRKLRKSIIARDPRVADWWVEEERLTDGFFDRRDRYAALVDEVYAAPDLFDDDGQEHEVECGLLCEPE